MRLRNKVSLITGSSRGIGRAIALTFAKEGSKMIVNYVKGKEKAEEIVDSVSRMGGEAIAMRADIAGKSEVYRMVDRAFETFGRIDILVNNAGITRRTDNILLASEDAWEQVLGVNLLGPYLCVQAVAPHMIKQRYGKIINISSTGGIGVASSTSHPAYASSKAAICVLTKRLAHELGVYNINVNAIAPGLINTDILRVGRKEEGLESIIKKKAESAALRRVGEPQDIANVALFLASDESSFITGQIITVDGGRFDFLSHSA